MKIKSIVPTPKMNEFREDLIGILRKHPTLRADEMLAITSVFVGQLIALQDQRTMTREQAMEIVSRNIELGNTGAITAILGDPRELVNAFNVG